MIWCQGKERPEVTQYLLPRDVLWGSGWFLFVLKNQRTESAELVLSVKCSWLSGPENKYSGWSAQPPSPPARHTDPKEEGKRWGWGVHSPPWLRRCRPSTFLRQSARCEMRA